LNFLKGSTERILKEVDSEKKRSHYQEMIKKITRVDALELYRKSHVNIQGYTTPFDWLGLKKIIQKYRWKLDDNKRYEEALKVLNTIYVDIEWTVAQHKEGALFAVKKCLEEKKITDTEMNNYACIGLVNMGLCQFESECISDPNLINYKTNDLKKCGVPE